MRRSPGHPRQAFIDSAGFLALVNRRDTCHEAAKQIWQKLTDQCSATFTTNFVIAECHALFLARLGHGAAVAFLRQMEQSTTTIVRVREADEDQARQLIYRYHDKDFSFTDATSFVVMERLRITYALTFDEHYTQYGLAVLDIDSF
ncbi:MAG: PIN domain-containing protein [Chloroflexota bacterium]|nr:MAG: PIN domain-containing protein [Chloroflexota bacterium]